MKALMGDTSDNIPGAPGIGPKTASALIVQYHDINNIFEHMDELKPPKAKKSISENVEQIKLSRFLSEIKIDVDVDYNVNEALIDNMFNEESYKLLRDMTLKICLKDVMAICSLSQSVMSILRVLQSFQRLRMYLRVPENVSLIIRKSA